MTHRLPDLIRQRLVPCLLVLCAPLSALAHLNWQIETNETTGLPVVSAGGAAGVRADWTFWGPEWKWAQVKTASQQTATPQTMQWTGQVPALGVAWRGSTTTGEERRLQYQVEMEAQQPIPHVVGGGLVFKFDLPAFGASMGRPELLPGNTGWRWGRSDGTQFTLRFEPALPKLYFERNNPAEIRAFFYDGHIPAGERSHTITLSWTGDAHWQPSRTERLGGPPANMWPSDVIGTRNAPVPLLSAKGGNNVGTASSRGMDAHARYWGTNVTAYALFSTPKPAVAEQAKRLAALGYNLVRLHHFDSPWVNPNVFGNPKTYNSTNHLSAESLDKLDWWIKCLKDEGIAVWLDLHVQRAVKPGDNIYGFEEAAKGKDSADLKGYAYVNLTMQQAMQRFNEAYLTRRNAYTGLAYKDDPAVVAIQITNENDITHHFGNALLPDRKVPLHHKVYRNAADAFARQHKLPADKVWRSWEHGPSKLFLNDLEQRFNDTMVGHLRGMGVKQALSTTSTWGRNPLSSLPALTVGDVVDVHSYGGVGEIEKDPAHAAHLGHWVAAAQVVGKPLTVSEWNAEPFPNHDRHTLPLLMAAMASHQGWRALMHYGYSQEPFERNSPSNWHGYNDPSLLPMLSAAALMYRRGDVQEATTTYVFDPGAEVFFNQAMSAANAPALRTAAEKGKLLIAMPETPALPWLERVAPPPGAVVLKDPNPSLLPSGAQEVTSDTGQLTRNWAKGTYTINTPRTQAALGWIGGEDIALPAARLKLDTRHASVAVQSLDDAVLGESRHVLLSIGTRSMPAPGNKTPFRVEALAGELQVKAPPGLKLYRNGPFNQWLEHPVRYANGHYLIRLDGKLPVQWLALRPAV